MKSIIYTVFINLCVTILTESSPTLRSIVGLGVCLIGEDAILVALDDLKHSQTVICLLQFWI